MRVAILAAVGLAACADVPASPTYVDDVRPILRASCTRCHGRPSCTTIERARFRLDSWIDLDGAPGVAATSERIIVRAADEGTMPPDSPLTDREREILRRWQRAGSPRGDAPADDRPTTIAITTAIPASEPEGGHLALAYDVRDPDGDRVGWSLGWRHSEAPDLDGVLVGGLDDGRGTVDVDLGVLPAGSYQLVVSATSEVADRPTVTPLGAPIAIGERDAAPWVTLLAPADGAPVFRSHDLEVRWQADDADSPGPLTVAISLRGLDGTSVPLATDDARTGAFTVPAADLAAIAPGRYQLELVVSDGTAERRASTTCPLDVR